MTKCRILYTFLLYDVVKKHLLMNSQSMWNPFLIVFSASKSNNYWTLERFGFLSR